MKKRVGIIIETVVILLQMEMLRRLLVSAKETIENREQKLNRITAYHNILNHWWDIKNQKKSLEEYFEANDYNTIAIYGMGDLGCHLYEELKDSHINILYAIDKGICAEKVKVKMVRLNEELLEVDAIIVTPVHFYNEIKEQLEKKVSCPIISLEDVVYGV